MAPSKLSPAERAFRKREAARLRQQRCRERKRQANLKKKMEEEAAKKQELLNASWSVSAVSMGSRSQSKQEEESCLVQKQPSSERELPLPPLVPTQVDSQRPHQHQHQPRPYHRKYSFSHHQQQQNQNPHVSSVISACESFPSIASEPSRSSDEFFDDSNHHLKIVPMEPSSSPPVTAPPSAGKTPSSTPMRPHPHGQMKSYSPHSVAVNFDSFVARRSPASIRMVVSQAPSPPLLTINEEEMDRHHHQHHHYRHSHNQQLLSHPIKTTTRPSRQYSSLPIQKRPLRSQVQKDCAPTGPPVQVQRSSSSSPSCNNIELDAVQAMLSLKSEPHRPGSDAQQELETGSSGHSTCTVPVRDGVAVAVPVPSPAPIQQHHHQREGAYFRYDQGMSQTHQYEHQHQHQHVQVSSPSHAHSRPHSRSHSAVQSGPYWQHSRPQPHQHSHPHPHPRREEDARNRYMERMMRAEALMQAQESYNSPGVYIYYREG